MEPMLERARHLARELPTYRAAHDTDRRLAPQVTAALREHGFHDCLAPRELGGAELAPAEHIAVLETLAIGDAATAWVVMTASLSSVLAAYLPRETAQAMWTGRPLVAGVFAPTGKLVDGRVTGKWSYASGARHADWFVVGALLERAGKPGHVICVVPAREVQIIENWDTLGLHGTGSHDIAIETAVPATHVTSVFGATPWTDAPLYRVPLFGLLATGIAAVGLGIARGAVDHAGGLLARARGEVPSAALAGHALQRARLDAARAYLIATATTTFDKARTGAIDGATRGELRLAASFVAHECAAVVRAAFHAAGGAGIRDGHLLQSALRDIETLLTHRMVGDRVHAAAVRAMLGIGAPAPDL
jgi:alkylation response protein AidB-like acyl-CoA dehydrogenase